MIQTNSIATKKYLSTLVERFFSNYQLEEEPDFVEFVKLWMKHAEESYIDDNGYERYSFWKTLSNLEDFVDIDEVPNSLLLQFMNHYAENFYNIVENVPYFVEWEIDHFGNRHRVLDEYGNIIYKYNNIRNFLKTSRVFFSSKGSYYSILYLFKLFGGKLDIVPLDRDLVRSSDKNTVLSAINPKTKRLAHLHGIDPDPYVEKLNRLESGDKAIREWWYTHYAYRLHTDLDEEVYKPIVLEILHPAGMKCVWKTFDMDSPIDGWGIDSWGSNDDAYSWGGILGKTGEKILSVSSDAITFAPKTVGYESNEREIVITNIGEGDLTIESITLLDEVNFTLNVYGGYFPMTIVMPLTIGLGESRTFTVKYNPTYIGNHISKIVIKSNDDHNEYINVSLSGNAI